MAAASLSGSAPSAAHDSDAPPGAPHNWLPREEWVAERWLPFEEARLYRLLGLDRSVLRAWLRNDHRTIAGLARSRGRDPRTLPRRLMAPWRGRVSAEQYQLLRERTERTVTQGHLAQHLFFHVFHERAISRSARLLFGVSRGRHRALRRRGFTQLEIAERHGRSRAELRSRTLRVLRLSGTRGVARRATPFRQATADLAYQEALIDRWMTKRGHQRPVRQPPHRDHRSASAG